MVCASHHTCRSMLERHSKTIIQFQLYWYGVPCLLQLLYKVRLSMLLLGTKHAASPILVFITMNHVGNFLVKKGRHVLMTSWTFRSAYNTPLFCLRLISLLIYIYYLFPQKKFGSLSLVCPSNTSTGRWSQLTESFWHSGSIWTEDRKSVV